MKQSKHKYNGKINTIVSQGRGKLVEVGGAGSKFMFRMDIFR